MPKRIPSYRHHRSSGQAVVTLCAKDFYLGPWQSKASRAEYDRLIAEWLANGRRLPQSVIPSDLMMVELLAAYWRFAQSYYVKNGRPTGQVALIKVTLRLLRESYGHCPASEFTPLALKSLQQKMVGMGFSRRYINDHTDRIKRMFKWAASEELLPVAVHQALATVSGLKKGRTEAKESEPVLPVPENDFRATLPHLPKVVRAMAEVQALTGCRPGEVTILRPCDVDRTGGVWCYVPDSHKTEHHDRQRRVYVGPRAQAVLRPWLLRPEKAFCFSPRESARYEAIAAPPPTTQKRKAMRPRPRRRGERYSTDSYRRAITRACERAGVEPWTPNQLRHSLATTVRREYGLEAAQCVLGHSRADVSEIYASRDFETARRIMLAIG